MSQSDIDPQYPAVVDSDFGGGIVLWSLQQTVLKCV
jgi:hypothetical protein